MSEETKPTSADVAGQDGEPSSSCNALLSESVVVGLADRNSPVGQSRRETHKIACDAKEKSDLEGMFAAYKRAVEERAEYEEMWAKTAMVVTKRDDPPDPVRAMKEVAIAAIELARDVAIRDR